MAQCFARGTLTLGLILILVLSPWTAADAANPSPTPAPAATPAPSVRTVIQWIDPRQWAAEVFTQVVVTLLNTIAAALKGIVAGILASPFNFINQTPPAASYANPTVSQLESVVRAIADAALALVILVGGLNVIGREQLGVPYHGVLELFPRVFLGALLVNTSQWWTRLAIDANNALCGAIGGTALPGWDQLNGVSKALTDALLAVVYLITTILLVIEMLVRLALIDVLLAVAPLALLCWVLPQSQGWSRLWINTFVSTVFVQFVQVLALKLGGSLITEIGPVSGSGAVLAIILGIGVLVVVLKIPAVLRTSLVDGVGVTRSVVAGAARPPGGGNGAGARGSSPGGTR